MTLEEREGDGEKLQKREIDNNQQITIIIITKGNYPSQGSPLHFLLKPNLDHTHLIVPVGEGNGVT